MSKFTAVFKANLIPVLFLLGGCAALWDENPVEPPVPSPQNASLQPKRIPGPDPGFGGPYPSLHFVIEGYSEFPQQVAEISEKIYSEVMNKTALYSFKPQENYRIVVYKNKEEFATKTGQPDWSGGLNTGREVFSYEQAGLNMVLAHEITHLIFSEFLGDRTKEFRWLNEGLAMNIEILFHPTLTPDEQKREWEEVLAKSPKFSMEEIIAFNPYKENPERVNVWYKTAASLTGYFLDKGGAFNFSLFLKAVRSGMRVDDAFKSVYSGKFGSAEELFTLWKGDVTR